MGEDGFYLVWSPSGTRPPKYKHTTFEAAQIEAQRLAEMLPGRDFYVMIAVSISQKTSVVTRRLKPMDEIPF